MADATSGPDAPRLDTDAPTGARLPAADGHATSTAALQRYGTIVVVGGGCYGSYYVRQLGRARGAGALTWEHLVVVDRDPNCRVALEAQADGPDLVVSEWAEYFSRYLDLAAEDPADAIADAIVPSPLMPHLLFDWLVSR